MAASAVNEASTASPALSAFLRGVERRAAVFVRLQSGDPALVDRALVDAMTAFRAAAARTPFGDWPRRFWSLLLAVPPLRQPSSQARWPEAFTPLAGIGHGPRTALLLRLAAGLGEADAAAALGVARPTYRLALRRALPRAEGGAADAATWRALGEAVQRMLRQIPPERLGELAGLREAVLHGRGYVPARRPAPSPVAVPRRPRWWWPAQVAVLAATALGLAATTPWAQRLLRSPPPPRDIMIEPLPPAAAPAATYDDDLALLAHPDLELLLAEGDSAALRDPAFHAWLAVELARGDVPEDVARPQREETAEDVDEAALEGGGAR